MMFIQSIDTLPSRPVPAIRQVKHLFQATFHVILFTTNSCSGKTLLTNMSYFNCVTLNFPCVSMFYPNSDQP